MPSMEFYDDIRREVSDFVPASKFISLRDFARRFAMTFANHIELIRSGELPGCMDSMEIGAQKAFGYMILAVEPCCHHVEDEYAEPIEIIKGLKAHQNTAYFLNGDFYFTPVRAIDILKEIDQCTLGGLEAPKIQGLISVFGGALFTKALEGIVPITIDELESRGAIEASWANREAGRVTGSPRNIIMEIAQSIVDQRFPDDPDVAGRRELDERYPNKWGI